MRMGYINNEPASHASYVFSRFCPQEPVLGIVDISKIKINLFHQFFHHIFPLYRGQFRLLCL